LLVWALVLWLVGGVFLLCVCGLVLVFLFFFFFFFFFGFCFWVVFFFVFVCCFLGGFFFFVFCFFCFFFFFFFFFFFLGPLLKESPREVYFFCSRCWRELRLLLLGVLAHSVTNPQYRPLSILRDGLNFSRLIPNKIPTLLGIFSLSRKCEPFHFPPKPWITPSIWCSEISPFHRSPEGISAPKLTSDCSVHFKLE